MFTLDAKYVCYMEINEITHKIIGCSMQVHNTLGNGFQEVIYKALKASFRLRALVREGNYKYIWTSSSKGLFTLLTAKFLAGSNTRIIFYIHGYDVRLKWKYLFYRMCEKSCFQVWVLAGCFRKMARR